MPNKVLIMFQRKILTIISVLLILQKPKLASPEGQMLSKTECEIERHWNFWVHGNRSIILLLKWSNSTILKTKQVYIHLC